MCTQAIISHLLKACCYTPQVFFELTLPNVLENNSYGSHHQKQLSSEAVTPPKDKNKINGKVCGKAGMPLCLGLRDYDGQRERCSAEGHCSAMVKWILA